MNNEESVIYEPCPHGRHFGECPDCALDSYKASLREKLSGMRIDENANDYGYGYNKAIDDVDKLIGE